MGLVRDVDAVLARHEAAPDLPLEADAHLAASGVGHGAVVGAGVVVGHGHPCEVETRCAALRAARAKFDYV